jgi:hypothetical protein
LQVKQRAIADKELLETQMLITGLEGRLSKAVNPEWLTLMHLLAIYYHRVQVLAEPGRCTVIGSLINYE